jgi:hypothetical protein
VAQCPRHSRNPLGEQPAGTRQVGAVAFVEDEDDAELLGHLSRSASATASSGVIRAGAYDVRRITARSSGGRG